MKIIIIRTQAELDAIFRIFSNSKKEKSKGCWEFKGVLDRKGYGKIGFKNKTIGAHRLIYTILNGKTSKDIAHDCDNPKCVNPMHLSAKTRKNNMKDALIRNRIKTSYRHKQSKLNKNQVEMARDMYLRRYSNPQIAKILGVSSETIRRHLIRFYKTQYGLMTLGLNK